MSSNLLEQLECVFHACNPDAEGFISLEDLANISRSHVGSDHVNDILEIFQTSSVHNKRVNFAQFCQQVERFVGTTNLTKQNNQANVTDMETTHNTSQANTSVGIKLPTSPQLGARLDSPRRRFVRRSPRKKCNMSGGIPLVNTSSEEELEDSFDRRIAESLELAAPRKFSPVELRKYRDVRVEHFALSATEQAKFLVRGSPSRNTFRKQSSRILSTDTSIPAPVQSATNNQLALSPIHPVNGNTSVDSSPFSTPPNRSSETSSRKGVGVHAERLEDLHSNRSILESLERKMESLQSDTQQDLDSPSSGMGSLKMEGEDEMVERARREAITLLEEEKKHHSAALKSLERQRQLERENFTLRIEQFQVERDKLIKENKSLKEKVELLALERELNAEEAIKSMELQEQVEENRAREKKLEDEYFTKIQQMAAKLEEQDSVLAEIKEDNQVLRSQNKRLTEAMTSDRRESKFRTFLGRESPVLFGGQEWEDPADIRNQLRQKEKELNEQIEANRSLKTYVEEILLNVMTRNPQILEKN